MYIVEYLVVEYLVYIPVSSKFYPDFFLTKPQQLINSSGVPFFIIHLKYFLSHFLIDNQSNKCIMFWYTDWHLERPLFCLRHFVNKIIHRGKLVKKSTPPCGQP